MRTIQELLSELRHRNVNLWLEGDRLRYKAPKETLTPELLQELRSRKAEIQEFLYRVNAGTTVPLQSIVPVRREGNLPLSFTQTRLWFLDQLEPNSAAYNMPAAYRLTGKLNITALEQSLRELIHRHESLRTTFTSVDGEPQQLIESDLNFTLPIIDLGQLPETERGTEAQRLIHQEAQEPFHLEVGPLFRVKLLRLTPLDHILLVTIHHIISDGWSMGVLRRELTTLYQAFASGQPSPLPELPIQYADFAVWQRQWLTGEVLETQLSYWKQQLGGQLPVLDLPTDRPRPAIQTYSGKRQFLVLSPELTQALKTLSQKSGVTLFMTLLAAFQILLYRYSGQEDIIIGTPIAGRNRLETEALIGFFANTLVLRTNLAGSPSFHQLLERVRQVTLGAYAHQEMPFEKLVEELQPERSLSRNPLFQVWFNMVNLAENELQLSELTVETIELAQPDAKFDLTLYIRETYQGLALKLVYNADLFEAATIQGMLGHYQTLLSSIVTHPSQQISTLPLLTATERQALNSCRNIVEPTNAFTPFRPEDIAQSIPSRFEQILNKYPARIAIKTQNYQWTYSQLNQQANRVAQILLKQEVKESERIALFLEQDAPMIAGILGVLKTGKTYVPVDPDYPKARVDYLLQDAQATVMVTDKNNWQRARELTQNTILIINIDDINLTDEPEDNLKEISPDTLAYILYTSGSTGKPKGVMQTHRNVLHFIRNYTNNLHINEQDKLTLLSSYSTDAALVDIFSALLNGATLYPINIKAQGLNHLAERLLSAEITIYHSTPTVYRHFVSSLGSTHNFPQLRLVVLGGEEVVAKDVDLYQEYFANECILVNGYGATESTFNLQYFINKQTTIPGHAVSLGYPLDETSIWLINEAGKLTDIYGEIAIRSPYIALGYWQNPELTAAVFLPDPEAGQRRIYRTGDMGRLRPDGSIEFLGRKDFQVKIRGFRIELGEVEAALNQHPHVRETVVIAREDTPQDKRLVAYVLTNQPATTEELRQFLQQKLPSYMVPSAFVFLEAFPLTPNGKIDRRSLPVADYSSHDSESTFVAPTDELELQLTKIWEQVLKVQPISINSNFFDLGGHSLLAVQLFTQIRKVINKDLPLATLFQAPTIAQLATIIHQQGWSTPWSSLVAVQPKGSQPPFFFHGGAADALSWARFARLLGEDQPFYALQRPDLDGKQVTETSVEELAALCLKEIRTVQPQGPYLLGGHCFGGTVAFEIAQQLIAQGEQVDLLALFDAYPPQSTQLHINRNSLSFRLRASFHKFDYWLHKTYYYHGRKLFSVGLPDKLQYIRQKLQQKISAKQERKLGYQQLNSQPAPGQKTEETLSHQLRYLRAEKVNREAGINYRPQIYPGKITLLRAKKQFAQWYLGELMGWEKLTSVGVEKYEIPGLAGNLFNQASAPLLAKQLQVLLRCIQSR